MSILGVLKVVKTTKKGNKLRFTLKSLNKLDKIEEQTAFKHKFKKVPYSLYKSKRFFKKSEPKYYFPATDTIIKRIKAQKKIDPKYLRVRFVYPDRLESVLKRFEGVPLSKSLGMAEGWARELASLNKDKPAIIVITFSPEEVQMIKTAIGFTHSKLSFYFPYTIEDNEMEYFFIPEAEEEASNGVGHYSTDPSFWKKPVSYDDMTVGKIKDNLETVLSVIDLDERIDHTKRRISMNMAKLLVEDLEFLKFAHYTAYSYRGKFNYDEVEDGLQDHKKRKVYEYLAYNACDRLVDGWSFTSGDSDSWAIAVQLFAQEEFKIDDAFSSWGDNLLQITMNNYGSVKNGLKSYLRRQYDVTQDYFRKNGITELVLFRGMAWRLLELVPEELRSADIWDNKFYKVTLSLQPISSFSCSFSTALGFATDMGNKYRMLAMVKVPVERVFTSCATGFGCRQEDEIVLLGGNIEAAVYCFQEADDNEIYSNAFSDNAYREFCKVLK